MKLTEAQLKAIVAEEVQAAIEEGLFGDLAGRARGAAGAIGGAVKSVGSSIGKAAGDVRTAVGKAVDDVRQASAAGEEKAQIAASDAKRPELISKLEPLFVRLSKSPDHRAKVEADIETLMMAYAEGRNLDPVVAMQGLLNKIRGRMRTAGKNKEKMAQQEIGDLIEPTAGGIGGRGGNYSASGGVVGTAESLDRSASRIAESIVRRITQESKRRR